MDIEMLRQVLQGSFQCVGCGTCCKNCDPITVYDEDVRALAKHFKIPYQKAVRKYTRQHPYDPAMRALKHTKPCKFFDQTVQKCKIYDARPVMCRTYPFLSPQQRNLPHIGIYDDCPGMLLTIQVHQQWADQCSDQVRLCQEYAENHPEVDKLFADLVSCASRNQVLGEDTTIEAKRILEKLKPHLEAIRQSEAEVVEYRGRR